MSRYGRWAGFVITAALCCGVPGITAGAADPEPADNQISEQLLHMSPQEQASKLADHLGVWCIGTRPFYMGTTKIGPAKGYAYWNVTCAGGQSYMIQLAPNGQGAAIDCKSLKEGGEGRECYKSF